jgi:hypothetical protein
MKNSGEASEQSVYCSAPKHYDLFSGCEFVTVKCQCCFGDHVVIF